VNLREALFETADQIEEELKREVGVKTADDVKLRNRFGVALSSRFPSFVKGHGVAGGVAFLTAKGAKLACGYTHVGGIDMAIDVEVGEVAVQALADVVGQPADCQNVRRGVEREPVFSAETPLSHHLGGDRLQMRVVGAKGMGRRG
jgi:hypothetical protein